MIKAPKKESRIEGADALDQENSLKIACMNGDHNSIIKSLNLNADSSVDVNVCLRKAVYNVDYDFVKFLLSQDHSKGVDPNVKNFGIIFDSADRHDWKMVDILLHDSRVKRYYDEILNVARMRGSDELYSYMIQFHFFYTTDPIEDDYQVIRLLAAHQNWDSVDYFLERFSNAQLYNAMETLKRYKNRALPERIKNFYAWKII